jgi:hypothetical protein
MKALPTTAIGAALLLLTGTASAVARPGPPLTLTALADIGNVYWRYDCTPRNSSWSLGIRIDPKSATTGVVFYSQKLTLSRELQPGQMHWFPFRQVQMQTLRASQSTEAGMLRAVVVVDFAYHHGIAHCYSYAPPRFTVEEYPR